VSPRADIRQIAKLAGVSVATVSRTLNQVSTVTPRLARRVRRAVEELNYMPNRLAQSLVSGSTMTLGVLVPDLASTFTTSLLEHLEAAAAKQSYEIIAISTGTDLQGMRTGTRRLLERRVDGIAILGSGWSGSISSEFSSINLPIYFIGLEGGAGGLPTLRVDYSAGIRQAIYLLAALRHKRIAMVCRASPQEVRALHAAAFCQHMREIQLAVSGDSILEPPSSAPGGRESWSNLLRGVTGPTALICATELVALEVLQETNRQGIAVPGKLSIIAAEDSWLSAFAAPRLTALHVSPARIAELAVASLLSFIGSPQQTPKSTDSVLPMELIIRESTALASS
jgi:DNA-binding LacI/PurR family transcriptional regulator